jgi:8-oxo-dGTP pyrophosphatase MutT (NUDIX family)
LLLLIRLPAPLHRALYRAAHAIRVKIWRLWRPRLDGVRILALDADERILLVRHSYGSDKWMPPGGGLKSGEDPVAAAVRETLEETGCVLVGARLLTVSNVVRVVRGAAGGEPRADGREIVEARFFALDDLPRHMPRGLAEEIRRWVAA